MTQTTTRTPDQIMADFEAGCQGTADIDMGDLLWEIIGDVVDTCMLAVATTIMPTDAILTDVRVTVEDYLVNHYGNRDQDR